MRHSERSVFEPLCLNGSDYHACESTGFVGCCDVGVDPCVAGGGCNGDALKPMTFNSDHNPTAFADQVCSAGSLWYTCDHTIPPFIGCCMSNPCSDVAIGCPDGQLTEGSLSSNSEKAGPWLAAANSNSAATTTTSSATQASSSPAETTASSGHKLGGGAIAGVAIGAAALVLLLIAALLLYRRRKGTAGKSIGYETKNPVKDTWTGNYPAPAGSAAASEVHQAPSMDVASKVFTSPGYPGISPMMNPSDHHGLLTRCTGSSHSSSNPAYTPYSPPQYRPVSELESPLLTFQDVSHVSPPLAELPSPSTASLLHQHNVRSTASIDSLGISRAFNQGSSPLSPHYEPYSREAHMGAEGRAYVGR